MPIYEYQCAACGRVMEKWQKFSDAPLETCPQCGGPLTKLISSCAFHLKGSGWYVTDYSGSHSNSEKSDRTESPSESKAPETPAADTAKPEAAPATKPKFK